jgi:hypothetical protein
MAALRHAILVLPALAMAVSATCAGPAAAQGADAPMLPPPPADAPPRLSPASDAGARKLTIVTGPAVVASGWCPKPDPTRFPADHDPTVVDSYPSQGATLPPGAATVRVTFDAPMSCDGTMEIEGAAAPCARVGAWALPARHTFLTQCALAPRTRYTFHFRSRDGLGFVGLSGRPAVGFDLSFDTSAAAPTPPDAPTADPRPLGGETVRAYVACIDRGQTEEAGACRKAVIDPAGPPDAP